MKMEQKYKMCFAKISLQAESNLKFVLVKLRPFYKSGPWSRVFVKNLITVPL